VEQSSILRSWGSRDRWAPWWRMSCCPGNPVKAEQWGQRGSNWCGGF
jgi:hypothetical protein